MTISISSINYCPVKSISFQSVQNCKIKKNIGIIGDRIFAFAKDLDQDQVKLFEKRSNKTVEPSIFRGNIYIDGVKPWAEREWLGKVITINNINFKVEKNIPRCVAINLKPKTDDNSVDLLRLLKKTYNHFDMGIFLTALEDGEISVGNSIKF